MFVPVIFISIEYVEILIILETCDMSMCICQFVEHNEISAVRNGLSPRRFAVCYIVYINPHVTNASGIIISCRTIACLYQPPARIEYRDGRTLTQSTCYIL